MEMLTLDQMFSFARNPEVSDEHYNATYMKLNKKRVAEMSEDRIEANHIEDELE